MKRINGIRNPQKKVRHYKVRKLEKSKNIQKSKKDFLKIVSLFSPALILTLFNNIKLYYESVKCENFYGVPKEYFYNAPKTVLVVNFIAIIVCCSIPFIPYLLKKSVEKSKYILNKFDALNYSILLFLSIFSILSTIFAVIIAKYSRLFKSECLIKVIIVILPFTFAIALSIICYIDLRKLRNINNCLKIANSNKNMTDSLHIIYNVIAIIYIIVSAFFLFDILFTSVEEKKKYEVAQLEDGDSKLVITHYENNLILMDYNKIYNTNNEEGFIVFNKDKYYIEPVDGLEIQFVNFNSVSNEGSMLVRLNVDEEEIGDEQKHHFEFRVKKNIRISDLKQIIDNVVAQESIIRNDRKFSYWYKDLENKKNFFIREDCKDINLDFDILNLYAEYE